MIELPRNDYNVILCDPPWSWVSYSGKQSAPTKKADSPYPVMTLQDMKQMNVSDFAAKDCALIMWVIGSHIKQAIELGEVWGFDFKSDLFTWVKVGKHDPLVRPIGMGKWARKQVEQAFIFTRGKPKRKSGGVRQLIEADEVIYETKREHSRKPDCQYERIEELLDGPYCELFSRTPREGWDAWGNDTERFAK